MASISIERAVPFRRGDLSIQILVDGKRAGSLFRNNVLTIEVPPDRHRIQTAMLGLSGQRQEVLVNDGDDVRLQLSGTRMLQQSRIGIIPWIMLAMLPERFYMLTIPLMILAGTFCIYEWRKQKATLLRLHVTDNPVAV